MFSREAFYAISSMLCLALLDRGEVISVKAIAERESIPTAFLEKILLKLKYGGLVVAKRGSQGGYGLARSPKEISVWEIFEAIGEIKEPAKFENLLFVICLEKKIESLIVHQLRNICLEDLRYDFISWKTSRLGDVEVVI